MNILLGVTGGIAAYKAAELVRTLQRQNVGVQVAMTESAEQFVRPLTFASLTGKRVLTSLWAPSAVADNGDDNGGFEIEHITIAQAIDALVIAPATARTIAKLANGLADDFLSTLYLATRAPVLLAPAMNVQMWEHPAMQENLQRLRDRGVTIIEPEAGDLACGMTGTGRLAAVETIAAAVIAMLRRTQDLADETILITAGGTREMIDPVRFIGNRSSGKMGHALADMASARGAHVILITAATGPGGVSDVTQVTSAEEMRQAVLARLHEATIVIMAAAVSDYTVIQTAPQKLKRSGPRTIELEPTADIVCEIIAHRKATTLVIAFAAETERLLEEARRKLGAKGVDAIVANDVSRSDLGFDSDRNAGVFLTANDEVGLPESTKQVMAGRILDQIVRLRVP